jgi:hypothetical protein
MKARTVVVGGSAAGGALMLLRRLLSGDGAAPDGGGPRWLVVTANRPPDQVAPDGRLPEPLASLEDVEVQIRPAPGDRGTEIAARPRVAVPSGITGAAARVAGTDPRQAIRTALRDTKMLLETGEILEADRQRTDRVTLKNLPLELATRRARGEGLL